MIRSFMCDLGFNIQRFPCKKPPGDKKGLSELMKLDAELFAGLGVSQPFLI